MSVNVQKKVQVVIFSHNDQVVQPCQHMLREMGVALDVFHPFMAGADRRLEKYALMIVDVEHPEMSGLHWAESMRQYPALKETPILFVSAFLSEAQVEQLNRQYAGTSHMLIRFPIEKESLHSMLTYFVERAARQMEMAMPKAVGAEDFASSGREALSDAEVTPEEAVGIQELYERQLMKEHKEESAVLHDVANAVSEDINYDANDLDTIRRVLNIKEKDAARLSQAVHKLQDQLDHAYATIDRLRLEIARLTKDRENTEVKFLTIQDEFERFRKKAERDRQALIEDFHLRMAQKELLEGDYSALKHRFDEFKRRIAVEIKNVRAHERELEAKIQMIRADADVLLEAKDQRIFELTKKIETLFEQIGELKDKIRKGEELVSVKSDRQGRVLKALKLASALLNDTSTEGSGGGKKAG